MKTTFLVLGGYGFLGTNIIKYIDKHMKDDVQVIVFDKFESHPAGVGFESICRSYAGDFSDEALITRIFDENAIDMVLHCISTTVPATSFNAKFDIESNLIPTVSLLDAMISHKVFDIVYLSSGGAIYGSTSVRPHKETDDVFPKSSYGVVKLAIEKYMMQYAELYGLRPLVLRLSNPYGPWHYSMKQGICNIAVADALAGRKFTVWGDGNGSKDYIFVEDFVKILFILLRNKVNNEVINVASGEHWSVNGILNVVKSIRPGFSWEYVDASMLDVARFELNTERLKSLVGNYCFTSLEDGVKLTFEWAEKGCCD